MKTFVAIHDPRLIDNVFDIPTLEQLFSISDVHWLHTLPAKDAVARQKLFDDLINDYDACITSWESPKIHTANLTSTSRLKFIGHAAGTLAPYLDAEIFTRNIAILSAGNILAQSTAELTLALMMAGSWNLHAYELGMKQGVWSDSWQETVLGLQNQTIGLIGFGTTSQRLIELLRPFTPRLLLYSRHMSTERAQQLNVELCPLTQLLEESRIVSLHATLTPDTIGMISRKQIEAMRDGALFVNTARAQLVDNVALLEHLQTGRISAALDVFDKEPVSANGPLLKLPNVFCAPHIGGFSSYWRKKIGEKVVDGLCDIAEGKMPKECITREKLLAMSAM